MNLERKYIQLFKGTRAAGVEITIGSDESIHANVVILKKQRKTIDVVSTYTDIDSIESLVAALNPSTPVFMVVNGRGVLHKKVTVLPDDDADYSKAVLKAFSGITLDDFIVSKLPLDGDNLLISLVRKEVVNSLVSRLKGSGIFVLNVDVDPSAIVNLQSLLVNERELHIPGYCLFLNEGHVVDVELEEREHYTATTYNVDKEVVDSRNLLAFASALNLFFLDLDYNQGSIEVHSLRHEFLFKQAFIKTGVISLAFFFLLLLGNYLLFSHYKNKVREKGDVYSQYTGLMQQLKTMEGDLKSREAFFGEHGLLESSRMSFYADRLVACMPSSVMLEELSLCPVLVKGIGNGDIKFKNKEIKVVGATSDTKEFNRWVELLQTRSWLNKVTLIRLEQVGGKFQTNFELMISLK